MKGIFNLLNSTEKRVLVVITSLLAGSLIFLFLFSLGEKRKNSHILESLRASEKQYEKFDLGRTEKKREWLAWEQAPRDMEELKSSYFYSDKEGLNELRLDLQQIFSESNINVSQIKYDYAEFEKEKVKKVNASFNFSGSYLALRKFLDSVERFPKFLIVEKVDFLKIEPQSGFLQLKIVLAGYYES